MEECEEQRDEIISNSNNTQILATTPQVYKQKTSKQS
jgi:hypothetical protein